MENRTTLRWGAQEVGRLTAARREQTPASGQNTG